MTIEKNNWADVQDGVTRGLPAAELVNDNKRAVNEVIDVVNGLGTASTKNVATNTQALAGTVGVLLDAAGGHAAFKQYGYGGQNPNNNALNCNDLLAGSRNSWSGSFTESTAVSLNLPALGGSSSEQRSWHVECFGMASSRLVQEATEVFGINTTRGRKFIRVKHDSTWYPWVEVQTTGNGATAAEVQAGTNTEKWISPAALSSRTATETRTGLVELATTAEAQAGTDTGRAVTPAGLAAVAGTKVDKVTGKGLSDTNFTQAEKTKLSGIASGAQVNSVTSVAGKTGAVTLTKGDVGLGNVDNVQQAPITRTITAGTGLSGGGDLTANRTLSVNYGTTTGTAAQGNDTRIVNALRRDVPNTSGFLALGSTQAVEGVARSIEIATNTALGGSLDNHTGVRLLSYMDGSWGNARLGVQISTGWGEYGDVQDVLHTGNGATSTEVQAGTDTSKWISPAALSSRTATETRTGLVEKATTAEAVAGTANKYPDAAGVHNAIRGLAVGTVSQSGGVPTGAIIERGGNVNGEYVRFADGTQICTTTGDFPAAAISTEIGVSKPHPAAFSSINSVQYSASSQIGSGAQGDVGSLYMNGIRTNATSPTNLNASCYLYREATSEPVRFFFTTTGRWY